MQPITTEAQAIAQLQQGDIEGLAWLVERYQHDALRTAALITHDRALAEDLVQSAFLRVFDKIDRFDSRRPFRPWFMKLVANAASTAAGALDRRHEDIEGIEGLRAVGTDEPEVVFDRFETGEEIWLALGKLPAAQRSAMVLRYLAGFSDMEVAEVLECTHATVRWRLHAARQALRAVLADLRPQKTA